MQLSYFYNCKVIVNDIEYPNGECAFHGSKYLELSKVEKNEDRKAELEEYAKKFEVGGAFEHLKPTQIKSKGGKKGLCLTEDELQLWESIAIGIQEQICKYKYNNYEEVRGALHATGKKVLIHPALRCSEKLLPKRIWEGKGEIIEGKVNVKGRNMLGKIWMKVRDEK